MATATATVTATVTATDESSHSETLDLSSVSPPPSSSPSSAPSSPPCKKKATYELTAESVYYAKPRTVSASALFYPRTCNSSSSSSPEYILANVTLTARPRKLLAVVGPSGAGKSTLLDILAARTTPTHGRLLLNSAPFRRSTFRKLSAHVEQHDSALPLLTVAETFAFAASMLRSPATAVPSLLSELRLSHVAHTRICEGRLSGGERRRVSIGLALLRDPGVLLLDEPTSGLDSGSAYLVVKALRAAAEARGTTVILSIHQPSSRILSTFDTLLLLSKGRVVHHGSLASLDAFLLSYGYSVPSQLNPLEYALEVLSEMPDPKPTSPILLPLKHASETEIDELGEISYSSSRIRETAALYRRSWKIVYRTRQLLLANFLEALFVGICLGTIYIHAGYDDDGIHKRLGFFAFSLTFLLSSTTETLPIFVAERPILLRESSSGLYRLSSHVIATTLVFLPYLLAISTLYAACVYFLVGLCTTNSLAIVSFVLTVWSVLLTANSFVLFLSSFAPDFIAGMSLVSVSLAGFFLFSGYFMTKGSMPVYWVFMHYLSPYKYGLDAMLANEYACAADRCFGYAGGELDGVGAGECTLTGNDVLEERGLRPEEKWTGLQVMCGFFLLYRILYWAILCRRAARSRR